MLQTSHFSTTMEDDSLKSIPLGQLMEMRKNGREIRGDRVSAKGSLFSSIL